VTVFVAIYHPLIPSTTATPKRVSVQAVDDYLARGWLQVDPANPPVDITPYLTQAAGDSRYVRDTELDAQAAALVPGSSSSALSAALGAALGSADPVLSNFTYDPATGNLLSYQEDGITITLTYNADSTVATSKRGSGPTRTFTYSGGNLAGVA
jgi:uncharacterized protein RhaS with RHS repeats